MSGKLLILPFLFWSSSLLAQSNPLGECGEKVRNQPESANPDPTVLLKQMDDDVRNCLVGQTFPSFDVTTITKNSYTKKDIEGKVVLLNFWFIACAPCVAEMPLLQELSKTYNKKDFLLLSFTRDEVPEVEKFLSEYKATFETVAGSGDFIEHQLKMTFGYPANFFLNKKGEIVELKLGGAIDEARLVKTKNEFKRIIEAELKK